MKAGNRTNNVNRISPANTSTPKNERDNRETLNVLNLHPSLFAPSLDLNNEAVKAPIDLFLIKKQEMKLGLLSAKRSLLAKEKVQKIHQAHKEVKDEGVIALITDLIKKLDECPGKEELNQLKKWRPDELQTKVQRISSALTTLQSKLNVANSSLLTPQPNTHPLLKGVAAVLFIVLIAAIAFLVSYLIDSSMASVYSSLMLSAIILSVLLAPLVGKGLFNIFKSFNKDETDESELLLKMMNKNVNESEPSSMLYLANKILNTLDVEKPIQLYSI